MSADDEGADELHDRLEAHRIAFAMLLDSTAAELPNGGEVKRDLIAGLSACEETARRMNAPTAHIDELVKLLRHLRR